MQLDNTETTLLVVAVVVGLCYLVRCVRTKKIYVEKSHRKPIILEPAVKPQSRETTVRLHNILKGSRLHELGLRNGRYAKLRTSKNNAMVKTSKTRFSQIEPFRNLPESPIFHEGFIWVYIASKQYKQ